MGRWAKSFLWLSSIWLLLAAHPSAAQLSPVTCDSVQVSTIKNGQYRTTIDFYKKHLTGILIFKQTADTTVRAVFTNEVGFKFFDFEFGPGTFKVNYILKGMDKKIVLKIFETDLGMVCGPYQLVSLGQVEDCGHCPQFRAGGKSFNYFSSNCRQIERIETGRKNKPFTTAILWGIEKNQPQQIDIKHKGIKLRMQLSRLPG